MNIFQSAWLLVRRQPIASLLIVVVLGVTAALGFSLNATERGLRQAVARAADGFDLVVGAPGSSNSLLLGTVFLGGQSLDALTAKQLTDILAQQGIRSAALLAFGDATESGPLVGTTAAFFNRGKAAPLAEGRIFNQPNEAVVGYRSATAVGSRFRPIHLKDGDSEGAAGHAFEFTVVGRMPKTGTPWDFATTVPLEALAKVHYRDAAATQAIVISPHSIADAYRLRHVLRQNGMLAVFPGELLVEIEALAEGPRMALAAVAVIFEALVFCVWLIAMALLVRNDGRSHLNLGNSAFDANSEIHTTTRSTHGFRRNWLAVFGLASAGIATGLAVSWLAMPALARTLSTWLRMEVSGGLATPELQLAAGQLIALAVLAIIPAMARSKP
jgi:putative ABC transport system permease protein